jgi:hypothetical protein
MYFLDSLLSQPVGWTGFIKPNIGNRVETDVGLDEASPTPLPLLCYNPLRTNAHGY